MRKPREYSIKLIEMIDTGLLDIDTVLKACINYMSESDIKDMMECNDFIEESEETCEE